MGTARSSRRCRTLIADSQAIFAHGLRRTLEESGDFVVVGIAADRRQLVRMAARTHPEIVFLDAGLSTDIGLTPSARASRDGTRPARVILLLDDADGAAACQALGNGAHGVLARGAAREIVAKAARCVRRGKYWVAESPVMDLVQWIRDNVTPGGTSQPVDPAGLSPCDRTIVEAVLAGRTNKEMANDLNLQPDTVKHHLTRIYRRFGVTSRLELAVVAMQGRIARQFDQAQRCLSPPPPLGLLTRSNDLLHAPGRSRQPPLLAALVVSDFSTRNSRHLVHG